MNATQLSHPARLLLLLLFTSRIAIVAAVMRMQWVVVETIVQNTSLIVD